MNAEWYPQYSMTQPDYRRHGTFAACDPLAPPLNPSRFYTPDEPRLRVFLYDDPLTEAQASSLNQ